MAERYWIETLGCPKNQVDCEKLVGVLAGRRPRSRRVARSGRSGRGQYLCLHRGCPAGVDRHHPRAHASARRTGSRLVVTGCLAERYRDELAEALPEVDLVAPFGVSLTDRFDRPGRRLDRRHVGSSPSSDREAVAGTTPPRLRPPQPAPTRLRPPLGLREGGGGLRPALRVLRDPVVPGSPAFAYGRLDPGRGRRPRRSRANALREVVLVAQDLASFGLDRSAGPTYRDPDAPFRGGRRPIVDFVTEVSQAGAAGPASSTSIRRPSTTRSSRRCSEPACPTSTSRCSTCRGLAQADAQMGRGRAVPRPDPLHSSGRARRRVPLVVHRRLPRRDRVRPRPAARVDCRGRSRLGGRVPVQPRGGDFRRRAGRAGPARADRRAHRRVHRAARCDHPQQARGTDRAVSRGPGRRARSRAEPFARRPRSTEPSASPITWRSGCLPS